MRIELLFLAGAPLLVVGQTVGPWGQCGGINWTGGRTCTSGYVCTSYNPYYSQCIPGNQVPTSTAQPPTTTVQPPTSTVQPPTTTTTVQPPTSTGTVPTGLPTGAPGSLQALMRAKGKQYFGVAVDQNTLSISQISSIVNTEFGSVTPENSMKWDSTERSQGSFSWGGADYLVNYAQTNGKLVRGHTLVWHNQLPQWVSNINSAATLTQVIENHVTTIMNRYKGKIHHWDVVNEVFEDNGSWRNSVFYRLLGQQFVDIAFRAAKAADPSAKLYINDYNLDYTGPKLTAMITLVNRLKAAGVPIDGIGSQAHLILNNGAIGTIGNPLGQLAATGVTEIAITELDIRIPMPADNTELNQQSSNYQTVTTACLNIPKCVGITVWGVDDGHSWVPDVFSGEGAALLWNSNYQKKPAYTGVVNALS